MASLKDMENKRRYNKYHKEYESDGRDYASEAREKSKKKYESLSELQKNAFKGEDGKKLGDFYEAPGGGTPADKNERGRGSMEGNFKIAHSAEEAEMIKKQDPQARVRTMQPRDEEGKFTYNSANLKERKYKYHGYGKWSSTGNIPADFPIRYDYEKMARMFTEGSTFMFRDENGKVKRFTIQTSLSADDIRNAITEYSEVRKEFGSGLGSEESFVERKGRMSKSQKEALGDSDFAVAYDDQIKKVTSDKTAEAIEKAKSTQAVDSIMESVKSVYNDMDKNQLEQEKARLQEAMEKRPELKDGFNEQLKLVEKALSGEKLVKEKGVKNINDKSRLFDEYKTGLRDQIKQDKINQPVYTEESVQELEKEIERTQDPEEKERLTNVLNTLKQKGGEGITTEESDILKQIRNEEREAKNRIFKIGFKNDQERKNYEDFENDKYIPFSRDEQGNVIYITPKEYFYKIYANINSSLIRSNLYNEDLEKYTYRSEITRRERLKELRKAIVKKAKEYGITFDKEDKAKTTTISFMVGTLAKAMPVQNFVEWCRDYLKRLTNKKVSKGFSKEEIDKRRNDRIERKELLNKKRLEKAYEKIEKKSDKRIDELVKKIFDSLNLGKKSSQKKAEPTYEEKIAKSMGLEKKQYYERLRNFAKNNKDIKKVNDTIEKISEKNPKLLIDSIRKIINELKNEKEFEEFKNGWGKKLFEKYSELKYNKEKVGK